jgi:hypothetical protein
VVKRLASLIAVLGASTMAVAVRAQPSVDPAPCESEGMAVVAAALKHALADVRDLPDLLLVEQNDQVYVSDYLWGSECLMTDGILPTSSRRTYTLLGRDEAQNLANDRGEPVAFARAGDLTIVEEEASVWVGAFLQPAQGDERKLTCCCGAQMFLRRDAGAWAFVRWGMRICA